MPMNRRTLVAFLATALLTPSFSQAADMEIQDVVVIGSGIAGCAAALSALEAGANKVLMLEQAPLIGGHSLMSSGSIAVISPKRQSKQNISDSVDDLWEDSQLVGGKSANEELIRKIGNDSEEIIEWLETTGINFSPIVFQCTGGLHPRCMASNSGSAGKEYVLSLFQAAKNRGLSTILKAKVTRLHKLENNLWEVTYSKDGETNFVRTLNVVIATGGFTDNKSLRKKYRPEISDEITSSAVTKNGYFAYALGDGIALAQANGAKITNMSSIQLLPLYGGRIVDYVGADIFVNLNGKRFVDEGASWKEIEKALLRLPHNEMWVITDSKSKKGLHLASKLNNGTIQKSRSIEEMADGMGIKPSVLKKTIDDYNQAVIDKNDVFGKKTFTQKIDTPPFYWGKEKLQAHMTLGGICINKKAEVLAITGAVIPGLFACGETTGNIFGHDRLGGMSLTSALVFGREAGINAASRALAIRTTTPSLGW